MNVRRLGSAAAWAGVILCTALTASCLKGKTATPVPITPSISVNQTKVALGGPLEITYSWKVEAGAPALTDDNRVLVHFLDSHEIMLFEDDHTPVPPPSQWKAGQTYTYQRTKFVPVYPYVGPVEVRMGLYPPKGERVALQGEDAGLREYRVARMELLPQTDNIFVALKDGWYQPESVGSAGQERTWTKREATVSFKNPKEDVVVYLQADTNVKAFDHPPTLTLSVGGKMGLVLPIGNSDLFLRKVRVKAADLGEADFVDLKLSLDQSFVPKDKGINTDDRELGLSVYNLFVAEADKVGAAPDVVDAAPLAPPAPEPTKGKAATKPAPAKPAPAKPAA